MHVGLSVVFVSLPSCEVVLNRKLCLVCLCFYTCVCVCVHASVCVSPTGLHPSALIIIQYNMGKKNILLIQCSFPCVCACVRLVLDLCVVSRFGE